MSPTIHRRVLQFALTICALILVVFTPLLNTASAPVTDAALLGTLPSSTQFDLTGFLQSATLSCATYPSDSGDPNRCGGTLTVNNHLVVVPAETIAILPASALTWAELFTQNPLGIATETGMALNDSRRLLTTYEFNVIGNRVKDPNGTNGCATAGGCDRYIAGMIHISQQDLNNGAGYINFIDYTNGEFEVGGKLGVKGTGARVIINDPVEAGTDIPNTGRYTRGSASPDGRFQVDPDNPTIASSTGYPMCIPRVTADPSIAGNANDPLCPVSNRPISNGAFAFGFTQTPTAAGTYYSMIRMDDPANVDGAAVVGAPNNCQLAHVVPAQPFGNGCLDPRKQAPMEIGDYVTYAGSLFNDNNGNYISAHTVIDDVAIYTSPGTNPAYVSIEVGLIGTGGLTIFGAGEAAVRTRFEGMTTDETRNIHLYGIDINPGDGSTSDRDWGTIGVDPGPPNGAVRGRWRFRPPCQVFGTPVTDKKCTYGPTGNFLPPTREVRAVVEGLQSQDPQNPNAVAVANGIFYGQYHAPIGEYIFPENVPGNPIPENNFNSIDFLAYGGYTSFAGTQVGVLKPWPSNVIPQALIPPTATINGTPYGVTAGGSITLHGSVNANATSPVTLLWTAGTTQGGTDLNGSLSGANTANPIFNATGLAAGTYWVRFKATNIAGSSFADAQVSVAAAPAPTIDPIPPQTVTAGTAVTILAHSPSLPLPTWTWTQAPGNPAVLNPFTQNPTAATPTANSRVDFTPQVAGTYTINVRASNANGQSGIVSVVITVQPATAVVAIALTPVEYRISKQRLVITATTNDPNVTSIALQPYLTDTGTTFDPATLSATQFTNTGGGIWTITVVGAPKPACNLNANNFATPCAQKPIRVSVTSPTPGGTGFSAFTALDRIRQ